MIGKPRKGSQVIKSSISVHSADLTTENCSVSSYVDADRNYVDQQNCDVICHTLVLCEEMTRIVGLSEKQFVK